MAWTPTHRMGALIELSEVMHYLLGSFTEGSWDNSKCVSGKDQNVQGNKDYLSTSWGYIATSWDSG